MPGIFDDERRDPGGNSLPPNVSIIPFQTLRARQAPLDRAFVLG